MGGDRPPGVKVLMASKNNVLIVTFITRRLSESAFSAFVRLRFFDNTKAGGKNSMRDPVKNNLLLLF